MGLPVLAVGDAEGVSAYRHALPVFNLGSREGPVPEPPADPLGP